MSDSRTTEWWEHTPLYRGGREEVGPSGHAYFTSLLAVAKTYGPVKQYRLSLKSPKYVGTAEEWLPYDSVLLSLDSSPVRRLEADGHDSVVFFKPQPTGDVVYTVFVVDGQSVIGAGNV